MMVDLSNMRLVSRLSGAGVPLSAPPSGGTFAAIGVQLALPELKIQPSAGETQEKANCASLKIQPPAGEERQLNTSPFPEHIAPLKIQLLAGEEASESFWSYGWGPGGGTALGATSAPFVQQKQPSTNQQGVLAASVLDSGTPDYQVLLRSFPAVVNDSKDLPPATHSVLHFFTSRLDGCTVFFKLDLQKGYQQVPVAAEYVPKTAVITPFGLFKFLRMPFGLRNEGQTIQQMMDQILAGLEYTFVYLDDVLITSKSHQEHAAHLQEVLV